MSGGSVRALTIALNVRDRATKAVGALKADLTKIEGKAVVAQLKANDAASKPIKNVAACLEATDKAAIQAFKSLGHFEKGTSLAERGVSRLRAAMQKANTTIEAYSRNVEKARKKTESLEKFQGAAAGMAAVTGGLIGVAMMTSAGTSKNLQAALNASASEEEAAQIEAWVRGGASGNRSLRALAARKGVVGAQGIDALSTGENLEFLDLIVKHGQAGGATEGEIESALEALYTGSPDTINDILGGFEISNDTINKQIETARATEASVWKDYTDEQMMTVFAVREYTRLMKERGEVETDAYTRLQNSLSDIRDNIGEVFGPVVALAAEATGAVAALVTKYPLAKYLIAAGLAVGFMGASILLLLPGLAVATSMLTVAGLATAGWAVLLLALAGVLAYVAKKTGILSKAWEMITGAWDSLQETDMGDLGKLALKVVFPPAALAALVKHIPGMQGVMERAERILTNVFDKLGEFQDKALDALRNLIPGWLKSIWSRLKEVFTGFIEAIIKTFGGLMPEGYKEQLEAYTQLQEAAAAGEAGDTAKARRYGILGYDAKDDEYKIANFVPAQNISSTEAARLTGGKGYATWAEYRAMSAEDQAKMTYGYGGLVKSEDMASLGYDVEGWKRFSSYLSRSGHKHPDAEDVAEVAAVVSKPGISTVIVEGGKAILTAPPGTGTEYDQEVRANSDAVREGVIEGIKSLNETPAGTGTEYDQEVRANSDAAREGVVEGIKSLNETPAGTGTEYDQEVRANDAGVRSKLAGIFGIGDGVGLLAGGGGIETTGLLIGHGGEEVSPADIVHKTTAAERLVNTLNETRFGLDDAMGRGEGSKGDTIINVPVNVTIHGVKESFNKFDLARLISNQVKRELGQWKT